MKKARKSKPDNKNVTVILRQMVMKEEALAKTLNKPLMKYC